MIRFNDCFKIFEAGRRRGVLHALWSDAKAGFTEARVYRSRVIIGPAAMGVVRSEVTYNGYFTARGWEIVVKETRSTVTSARLAPAHQGIGSLSLLSDYLADESRAADLSSDFAALTIRRFTKDWELSGRDIETSSPKSKS